MRKEKIHQIPSRRPKTEHPPMTNEVLVDTETYRYTIYEQHNGVWEQVYRPYYETLEAALKELEVLKMITSYSDKHKTNLYRIVKEKVKVRITTAEVILDYKFETES